MYRKGENIRILILSCNTGGGHNAAGRAVKEIFEKNGDEAVMLDYLCLAGNKVSKTVGNVYIETVKKNMCPPFDKKIWQRNYYEHIIRDESDYIETKEYILNNPLK